MSNGLESLPTELRALGIVTGMLVGVEEDPALNQAWFEHPFTALPIKQPTLVNLFRDPKRVDVLLGLMRELIGEAMGGAVAPASETVQGEVWFPPLDTESKTTHPTFHLVTELSTRGLQMGLGLNFCQRISDSSDLTVSFTARVPLLFTEFDGLAGSGDLRFPFHASSQDGGPGFFRFEVSSPKPLKGAPLSIKGFRLELQLPLDNRAPSLELILLGLGGAAETPFKSLKTVDTLMPLLLLGLTSAIEDLEDPTAQATLLHLLSILGLGTDLPSMPWKAMVNPPPGKDGGSILLEWFKTLSTTPDALALWMGHWQALVRPSRDPSGTSSKGRAGGEGSRQNPWRIDLPGLENDGGKFALTLANESTGGASRLIPGLSFASPPLNPQSPGISSVKPVPRFGVALDIDLLDLPLDRPDIPITPVPRARLVLNVRDNTPGKELAQGNPGNNTSEMTLKSIKDFKVGYLNAGLELENGTGTWAVKPLLELRSITYTSSDNQNTLKTVDKVDLSNLNDALLSFPTAMKATLAVLVGTDKADKFGGSMFQLLTALGIGMGSPAMPRLDETALKAHFGGRSAPIQWLRARFSPTQAPKTISALVDLFSHSKVTAVKDLPTMLSYKPNSWLELQVGRRDTRLVLEFVVKGINVGFLRLNAVEKDKDNKEIQQVPTLSISLPDNQTTFEPGFQLELSLHPKVIKLGEMSYCPIIGARFNKKEGFCLDAWPAGRMNGQGFRLKLFPKFAAEGDAGDIAMAVAPILILLLLEIDDLAEWLTKTQVLGMSLREMIDLLGLIPKVKKGEEAVGGGQTSSLGATPSPAATPSWSSNAGASNRSTARETALAPASSPTFIDQALAMLMPLITKLGTTDPMVTFEPGKLFYTTMKVGSICLHGVRLELSSIPLIKRDDHDKEGKSKRLELEFSTGGVTGAEWVQNATGVEKRTAGISVFLFERAEDAPADAPWQFHPWLDLVGLELNLSGPAEKPLIDLDAFRLGGLRAQLFLALDFGLKAEKIQVPSGGLGAWLQLDDVGISIGKGFENKNPVAQYLLDGKSIKSEDKSEEAVIPEFSLAVSYRDKLRIHLGKPQDAVTRQDDGEQVLWFPIHKKLGPLYVLQLGVRQWKEAPLTQNSQEETSEWLGLVLDAGLEIGPLAIQVDDLSVGFPLSSVGKPQAWKADLKGLAVSIETEGFSLTGGLRKTGSGETLSYDGLCIIETAGRTVSALGSYTKVEGESSLFAFLVLPIPLGGPPMFFVEGLALGFGYNRTIRIPGIAEIGRREFPLLKALGGGKEPDEDTKTPKEPVYNETALAIKNDPKLALTTFGDTFRPLREAYFLAVGLDFTSFKLVQTQAILYVLLNRGFELGLIGVSSFQLPKQKDLEKKANDTKNPLERPLVNVEMALQVRFSTQLGRLSIEAQLTESSYLLDPSCKLTGGFAFYLWFGSQHRGDFVICLGGYHPRFKKPDHYPLVPRLGFRWALTKTVTIKGEAYFALTPSCVMAGGRLEAVYQAGGVRLWFIAAADFLISWKPFFYDIELRVSIGAEVRFELFGIDCKLKLEVGARLWLWGPPFAGEVEIDLCVVSVTVQLGSGERPDKIPLPWGDFCKAFLPPHNPYPAANEKPSSIYKVQVERGLFEAYGEEPEKKWVLRNEFSLNIETTIPYTALDVRAQAGTASAARAEPVIDRLDGLELEAVAPADTFWRGWLAGTQYSSDATGACLDLRGVQLLRLDKDGQPTTSRKYQIDIRPMAWVDKPTAKAGRDIESTLRISVQRVESGQAVTLADLRMLEITVLEKNLPAALWDASYGSKSPEAKNVSLPAGVRIAAIIREDSLDATGIISLEALRTDPHNQDTRAPLPFDLEVMDRSTRTAAISKARQSREPKSAASGARRYRRAPPIQEDHLADVVLK